MCSYFLLGFVRVGLALFFLDICSRDTHLCLKYLVSIPLSFFPSSLISHKMGLGLILLVIFVLVLSLFLVDPRFGLKVNDILGSILYHLFYFWQYMHEKVDVQGFFLEAING